MKKQLLLNLVFAIVLVITILLVSAEEEQSNVLKQKLDVTTNPTSKQITYKFTSTDSALRIGNQDYWNIQPEGTITTDASNKIIRAEFTVNEKGGTYTFGNDKIYAPPNSKVWYDSSWSGRELLSLDMPEGSEIKEPSLTSNIDPNIKPNQIQFDGKNLKLPGGAILQEGEINYKNGQFFVERGGPETKISGLIIASLQRGNTNLFFNEKIPPNTDGISIDIQNKLFEMKYSQESPKTSVSFEKDNPFIEIKEGDHLKIKPIGNFEVSLQNRDEEQLPPKLILSGAGRIEEGKNWFYSDEKGAFYVKEDKTVAYTSPSLEINLQNPDGSLRNNKYLITNAGEIFTIPSDIENYNPNTYQSIILPKSTSRGSILDMPTKKSIEENIGVNKEQLSVLLAHNDKINTGSPLKVLGNLESTIQGNKVSTIMFKEFDFDIRDVSSEASPISDYARKNGVDIILTPDNRNVPINLQTIKTLAGKKEIVLETSNENEEPESVSFWFDKSGQVYAFGKQMGTEVIHKIPSKNVGISICGELCTVKDLKGVNLLYNPAREGDDLTLLAKNMLYSKFGKDWESSFPEGWDLIKGEYGGFKPEEINLERETYSTPALEKAGVPIIRCDINKCNGLVTLPPSVKITDYKHSITNDLLNIEYIKP